MRRKEREITEFEDIIEVIKKCDVCRVAFFDEEFPYIIPLNFGFNVVDNGISLYFHGAKVGKKLELLKKNNKIAFEMDCSHKLLLGEKACDATMEYESVCGNGILEIVDDEKKIDALNHLMMQYTGQNHYKYGQNELNAVTVLKLSVNEIYGKALKRA